MKDTALLVFMLMTCTLTAQVVWIEEEEGKVIDHMNQLTFDAQVSTNAKYNGHSSFSIKGATTFNTSAESSGITIFSIFNTKPGAEEGLIWRCSNDLKDVILGTNRRVANLDEGAFFDITNNTSHQPKLATYFNSNSDGSLGNIILGGTPLNSEIPVNIFEGDLLEFIAFDKVLSPSSVHLIEGILSLKYGLDIPHHMPLISLNNEMLWDRSLESFQHRLSGIGRLESLRFNQQASSTPFAGGQLSIRSASNSTNDNSFVLWADDNGPVHFKKEKGVEIMKRSWLIDRIRHRDSMFQLKVQSDLFKYASKTLKDYAVITQDHQSNIYPIEQVDDQLKAEIKLSHGKSELAFVKAPEFWAWIDTPELACGESGQLRLSIQGGYPPYTISISSDEQHTLHKSHDIDFKSPEVKGGQINLELIDAIGNTWTSTINLNYSDLPSIGLQDQYLLGQEIEPLDLGGKEVELTWLEPDGRNINSRSFIPTKTGQHQLIVEQLSCSNRYDFEVSQLHNIEFQSNLYPNPAPISGQYLTLQFKDPVPYEILITTLEGKIISSEYFPPISSSHHQWTLPCGLYLITILSGDSVQTNRLIVTPN